MAAAGAALRSPGPCATKFWRRVTVHGYQVANHRPARPGGRRDQWLAPVGPAGAQRGAVPAHHGARDAGARRGLHGRLVGLRRPRRVLQQGHRRRPWRQAAGDAEPCVAAPAGAGDEHADAAAVAAGGADALQRDRRLQGDARRADDRQLRLLEGRGQRRRSAGGQARPRVPQDRRQAGAAGVGHRLRLGCLHGVCGRKVRRPLRRGHRLARPGCLRPRALQGPAGRIPVEGLPRVHRQGRPHRLDGHVRARRLSQLSRLFRRSAAGRSATTGCS